MPEAKRVDVVVVGAGFSGLYMLHRLRGLGLSTAVVEAGSGVGGTWYWNRYPGARVDVESQEYSYSFSEDLEREWQWSERYAPQPELLAYLNHVADRFDLRRDIRFDTLVTEARFDETAKLWRVVTDKGDRLDARFCVMATGCLNAPKTPDIPGAGDFRGATYSTSTWPKQGVDFTGKRVGVIGTGSSAVQSIPIIASQAKHLYVFQRTPCFSVPAHNGPVDPHVRRDWQADIKGNRQAQRESGYGFAARNPPTISALEASPEQLEQAYEERWQRGGLGLGGAFTDIVVNKAANDTAVEFVASKIRSIVKNPGVAEKLIPRSYPLATKRMCVDTDYYATFNRPNVTLVDISEAPIEAITPTAVRAAGQNYEIDALVYALGFDAMTGALDRIDIRGRGGAKLKDKWAEGPKTYLGLMSAGFPNLFLVTGPGSPSVLSNMVVSIEQHVDWITDCIGHLRERQADTIEAVEDAETAWVAHVNAVASMTLFPQAKSWYMGANVPGKPRIFMPYVGGVGAYRQKCDEVAAKGYEGFAVTPAGR
ncbi:MAG TPA: NAD(P)/FAD-dependent oxidoreductase [Hyphomonadaceae bacterium]|nr:NAD(P)/FAD-dependent oxidoreductase [Hyphomonadaceae bacterium]